MTTDEWIALGSLLAAAITIPSGWILWRRSEAANQRRWDAERNPELTISMVKIAYFPTSGRTLEEGENLLTSLPPTHEAPEAAFRITISNIGPVVVNIDEIGIRLARTNKFLCFLNGDQRNRLDPVDSRQMGVCPADIRGMLELLDANDPDYFTIDVVDAVGRCYSSKPFRAATHLKDIETFKSVVRFKSPITVSQISDESPVTPEMLAEFRRKNTNIRPD